jgi:hypothetical protein
MNGIQASAATHPGEDTRVKASAGGFLLEAFGAIATVALAIVGLARIWPMTMAAIATIVVGAATLLEGGALTMRSGRLFSRTGAETEVEEGATSMNFLGGLAAVVLGILALLGIAAPSLIAVAVLALGATFAFTGRFFVGLGAVVLGILAICGLSPETLFLVGLLVLGAGLLMSGSQSAARTLAA